MRWVIFFSFFLYSCQPKGYFSEDESTIVTQWKDNLPHYKWLPIRAILPQSTMIWAQPRLSRLMKFNFIIIARFWSKEWPKNFIGRGDQTCYLVLHFSVQSRLLRLAFLQHDLSHLVKWLFSRITLRWSPFFMAGVEPSLSRVFSIQTTPPHGLGYSTLLACLLGCVMFVTTQITV